MYVVYGLQAGIYYDHSLCASTVGDFLFKSIFQYCVCSYVILLKYFLHSSSKLTY